MNKMMMAVAGAAMAVVLAGCSGSVVGDSPSSVAEDFANAIIEKRSAEALDLCDIKLYGQGFNGPFRINPKLKTKSEIRELKNQFEKDGKALDDEKMEGVAVMEVMMTPSDDSPTFHVDGKEYKGECATVTVQCAKGKSKKDKGMEVELVKIDGSWKVIGYHLRYDLDDLYLDD